MRRRYFNYRDLEEFADGGGMWRSISGPARVGQIEGARSLMETPGDFAVAMRRVLQEWPNSCASNLTGRSRNRRAWIGHAGCYLAAGSLEESTRAAWHELLIPRQRAANAVADLVIEEWRAGRVEQLRLFGSHHHA